ERVGLQELHGLQIDRIGLLEKVVPLVVGAVGPALHGADEAEIAGQFDGEMAAPGLGGAPGAEPPEGGGQTAVFSRLDAVAHRAVIAMDRVSVRRVVPRGAPSARLGRIVDLEPVARAGHDLQPQPGLPATLRPEERRDGVTRTPTLERAAIRPIAD